MNRHGLFATIILLSILPAPPARAQERDAPKVEVGVQFTSLSLDPPGFGGENVPAAGARFTYNFNDYFAVEAEANLSLDKPSRTFTQGGHFEQLQAGVKAGKRWRRFGLFGKARPGFVSFEDTARPAFTRLPLADGTLFDFPSLRSERKTHFSADVGGVLEFYPSRRVVVRFDAGDTLIRYGEHDVFGPPIVVESPGGPVQTLSVVKAPSRVIHNFQFSAGVGFRFRGGRETAPAGDTTGGGLRRFEVGAQFTSLFFNVPESRFGEFNFPPFRDDFDPGTRPEEGFGARVGFNLNDHVALEAEGNFFAREDFSNNSTGGSAKQLQAGLKAGRRWARFGLFGKARPGFVNFNRVLRLTGTEVVTAEGQQFVVGRFDTASRTYFSMDVGGVLEYYPARRFFTRFDLGDTIIRYGERQDQGFDISRPVRDIPPENQHNFQFSAGVGFRF
ncbi:MAG: porin family protein [Acidobacteriota bacterium]|nr:porin family protein [Acidobacteriota bacterium]